MSKKSTVLSLVFELSKIRITIAVAVTTITGYVLASAHFDLGFIYPTLGIFFMACGSSVINHIQERKTDGLMNRTRSRPMPSGKLSIEFAVILVVIWLSLGSYILYYQCGNVQFILGWIALIWYNLIYTQLKKITPHAVIPGSIIGAIPPLVGWVSGGGELVDYRTWILALFFFLWQIPHFYLLSVKYGREYLKAGLPSIVASKSVFQIQKIVFLWTVASTCSAMLVTMVGITKSVLTLVIVGVLSVRQVYIFMKPLSLKNDEYNPDYYFKKINYYVLMVVFFFMIDRWLFNLQIAYFL